MVPHVLNGTFPSSHSTPSSYDLHDFPIHPLLIDAMAVFSPLSFNKAFLIVSLRTNIEGKEELKYLSKII